MKNIVGEIPAQSICASFQSRDLEMAEEPPPEESLFERFESKDEDRRQIWTMRLHERAFYKFIPVRERLRFRLFSTGYKLEQSRVAGVIREY